MSRRLTEAWNRWAYGRALHHALWLEGLHPGSLAARNKAEREAARRDAAEERRLERAGWGPGDEAQEADIAAVSARAGQ